MSDEETMKLRSAYYKDIRLLTRPGWDEHAHVEIQVVYVQGRKVGGVRTRGRHTLQTWVMSRDADGERKVREPEQDGWTQWNPPDNVAELAEKFGWETYRVPGNQ